MEHKISIGELLTDQRTRWGGHVRVPAKRGKSTQAPFRARIDTSKHQRAPRTRLLVSESTQSKQ